MLLSVTHETVLWCLVKVRGVLPTTSISDGEGEGVSNVPASTPVSTPSPTLAPLEGEGVDGEAEAVQEGGEETHWVQAAVVHAWNTARTARRATATAAAAGIAASSSSSSSSSSGASHTADTSSPFGPNPPVFSIVARAGEEGEEGEEGEGEGHYLEEGEACVPVSLQEQIGEEVTTLRSHFEALQLEHTQSAKAFETYVCVCVCVCASMYPSISIYHAHNTDLYTHTLAGTEKGRKPHFQTR